MTFEVIIKTVTMKDIPENVTIDNVFTELIGNQGLTCFSYWVSHTSS